MTPADYYYKIGLERGREGLDSPLSYSDKMVATEAEKRAASAGWKRGLAIFERHEAANEAAEKRRSKRDDGDSRDGAPADNEDLIEEDDFADSDEELDHDDDLEDDDDDDDDTVRLSPEEYANFKRIEAQLLSEEARKSALAQQERRERERKAAEQKAATDQIWKTVREEFARVSALGGDLAVIGWSNDKRLQQIRNALRAWVLDAASYSLLYWDSILTSGKQRVWTAETPLDEFCKYVIAEHWAPILRAKARKAEAERIEELRLYEIIENTLSLDFDDCVVGDEVFRKAREQRGPYVVSNYGGTNLTVSAFRSQDPDVVTMLVAPNFFCWVLLLWNSEWAASNCSVIRVRQKLRRFP